MRLLLPSSVAVEAVQHEDPQDGKPWPVVVLFRNSETAQNTRDVWLQNALRPLFGKDKDLGLRPARYLPSGVRRRVHDFVPAKGKGTLAPVPPPDLSREALSEALAVTAEDIVGRHRHNGLWSPYTARDKQVLQQLDKLVQDCYTAVRLAQDRPSQVLELESFRVAKRKRADFRKYCRKRWLREILTKLNAAVDCHDMRTFHDLLRQMGVASGEAAHEGSVTFSLAALREQALKSSGIEDPVSTDLIDKVVPQLRTDTCLGVPLLRTRKFLKLCIP